MFSAEEEELWLALVRRVVGGPRFRDKVPGGVRSVGRQGWLQLELGSSFLWRAAAVLAEAFGSAVGQGPWFPGVAL